MTNRRLATLFVLAIIGYSGLFFLFPRTNPAALWNFGLDRAAAVDKVKAVAPSYGFTASSQTESVRVDYHRTDEYYLSRRSGALLDTLVTPLSVRVKLTDPKSGASFEARLDSRGELLGFRRREAQTEKKQAGDASQQAPAADAPAADALAADQKTADEALKQFLGERYGKFSYVSGSNAGREGRKFSWAASDEEIRVVADVIVRDEKVMDIWLQSNPTPKFQTEYRSMRGGAIEALSSAENILVWPAIIPLIIIFFVGLARRRIDHRKTMVFLACVFLLLMVANSMGNLADELSYNFSVGDTPISPAAAATIRWVIFAVINLFIALSLYLFLAAGLSLYAVSPDRAIPRRSSLDLELVLKGKLLRRPAMVSILAGLLCGGFLAAIPHAVTAIGSIGGASINAAGLEDIFTARNPAIGAILSGSQFLFFMTFAFLIPVTEAYVKRMWIARILVFVIVFAIVAGLESLHTSAPALALASLSQAYLLIWLYRNFGLLSVMLSSMASEAALSSASLLAQQSITLQSSGRQVMIGLGVMIIAALVGFRKSREPDEAEIAVKAPVENRAERDRLQAEFDVARRAQRQMLPDAPPPVPGINISAVCRPSKDVGGDLYDFLSLPEGRVGVVVADVSGKGVPASLYMTLTKGLLDSVTEEKTDPGEILREVNRHLYEVCRRKTFVTMFLGVLDPVRKTLSYARGGHNPTIIHRASERKTWYLKPPGMGLGLNGGRIFDQSLKVETLRLEPGDKLFFYSDGITEAMNAKRDEYGEERLMVMAERTNGLDAEQSRDAVMADVAEFLGPVPPQDDQTLVVLQVL